HQRGAERPLRGPGAAGRSRRLPRRGSAGALVEVSRPPAPPPYGLLAELTHACPLRCVYCSNPLALVGRREELATHEWVRVVEEAASIGVVQTHLSGGEPLERSDVEEIVRAARSCGLYTQLVPSGLGLTAARLAELANVQLYGWALANRTHLLPSGEQLSRASERFRRRRAGLGDRLAMVWVRQDYFEGRPKPCMNGWGTTSLTVAPDGRALPCPAA